MVVGGLEAYEHDIAEGQLAGIGVDMRGGEGEGAQHGIDLEAVLPDMLVVGMQQKVNILACLGKPTAIVASDTSGAYH